MELNLNSEEKILFSLLKSALHQRPDSDTDWKSISKENWEKCYFLAIKHGVVAIAWDGIQLLAPDCMPPRMLKLTWAMHVEKYEIRYERYCRIANELSAFYAEHDIAMVQMKGVGLSSYYPIPSHREGGDIDIYTYSRNTDKMSNKEANLLADDLITSLGIDVDKHSRKHSNFYYKGIPIENHKYFINVNIIKIGQVINDLLLETLNPQDTFLCNGKYKVLTPSPDFNAIFLSFHAAQHYCSGFKIHHLFDWACMLKEHGLKLSDKIEDKKFLRFIYALTNLSNDLLGTKIEVPTDYKMVKSVCNQMMHWRFSDIKTRNRLKIIIIKATRFIVSYFKTDTILEKYFLKSFSDSIRTYLKKPKLFFTNTFK